MKIVESICTMVIILIVGITSSCAMTEGELGKILSKSDLSPEDANYKLREKNENGYLSASGDYDGNGIVDEVYIYSKDKKYHIIVHLNGLTSKQTYRLREGSLSELSSIGIDNIKPNTYRTACSKGYGKDCQQGEKRQVTINHTGISIFTFESASRIYYWDKNQFNNFFVTD